MARPATLGVFARRKRKGEKIVVLTAYDLTSARIAARGGVDAILVGDSVGMVVLGHETTLPVTVDDMVHHTRAVTAARTGVPVIADLPYGSFHVDAAATVAAGLRLVKEGGAAAVKLEGGRSREAAVRALLDAEIPVMGHLGLTPQSVHRFGGWKVQGRGAEAAQRLREDALFLQDLGCFSLVLECVPAPLAAEVSAALAIPTIGIGAGPGCDGQVLVFHDLLGLFDDVTPSFVKRYAELSREAADAVARWREDVRAGAFPAEEHCFFDDPPAADRPAAGGYLGDVDAEGDA